MNILSSRRFWTLLIATATTLVLYFTNEYAPANVVHDVNFVIAATDSLAGFLILFYTVDDIHTARVDAQVEVAKLNSVAPHG